jgi:pyridoxal phosphate enzyme (YggS family)
MTTIHGKIRENLQKIHKRIEIAATSCGREPSEIQLLAVSKTKPAAAIREAYAAGQRRFGENYVQEAVAKMQELSDLDIEWHYIGGIQSNKTRIIAAHFDWAHGVASLKHARRLSEQRPDTLPPLDICLQVNISGESSKQGVIPTDAPGLAAAIAGLPHIRLRGLMALPEATDDPQRQQAAFRSVRELLESLNRTGLQLDTLSMGMSNDLEAAIGEGATMVRIGTAIFGARN